NVSPNVVTLTGGVFSGNVTLAVPGTVRLIANWAAISGTSGTILVQPPPAIYGLSTFIGYAPGYSAQYLQTGSSVTITGYGFGPGTKVRFNGWAGDSYLLATPTGIAADGTSLTVNVPLFAQTGPLVVNLPDGTSLQSSQPFTVRDYRNTYGFSFNNFNFNVTAGMIDGEYGSPVSAGHLAVGWVLGCPVGGGAAAAAEAAAAAAYWGACAAAFNGKGACFGMILTTVQMANNPGLINATNGLPSGAAATV